MLLLLLFVTLSLSITALEMKQARQQCDKTCRRSKVKSKCITSCIVGVKKRIEPLGGASKSRLLPHHIAPKIVKHMDKKKSAPVRHAKKSTPVHHAKKSVPAPRRRRVVKPVNRIRTPRVRHPVQRINKRRS